MINKHVRAIGVGAAVFMLAVPLVGFAATFRTGDTVDLRGGEGIADDVYAAGGTVTSASIITGDLYAGGGTVLVTGPVSADAVIGGGTVTVTSTIGDDLRIGGGTIIVQGTVGGDVVVGGGQIHLAGRSISGDVLAGGGMVRVDSPVAGDLKAGGGEVYINAPVSGNVTIEAEKITLGSNAVIIGNLTYKSPQEVVMEPGAEVRGQTTYTPTPHRSDAGAALAAFLSIALLIKILMLLAGALVFGLIFNRYSTRLVHDSFAKPLAHAGVGLIVLILMPVLSILLLVTVIGIPLGILGFLAFGALMIFSWLMAPVLLGSFIYQWFMKGSYLVNWKTILVGVLAYVILSHLPFIGWLLQLALMLVTLGAIVKLKWHLAKQWR